ncbi:MULTISPECIES: ABC transporter ATP-binding protein [Rhizobium/Agrobacterium group]|uniref:ABC transporter ATP-binding protein n=1 Tax=Rhizobium oryzihabitans TaxID=2267833 RepID=UPI00403468AA
MRADASLNRYKRLWRGIAPRRRLQFSFLLVFMVLASFADILSIGAVVPFLGVLMTPERVFSQPALAPVIQWLGITEPQGLLFPFTMAFAVAAILAGAMRLMLLYAQTRLSHGIGADFSLSIYRRTLFQPYRVHINRNSSELIAAISSKTASVVYQTLLPLLSLISSCFILTAILAALIAINPQIALVAFLGFGLIYAGVVAMTRRALIRDGQRANREQARVVKALQEGLGGIRDVLLEGAQETYVRTYRSADAPMRRAQANIQIVAGSPRYGIEAVGMVFIAALSYWLAIQPEGIVASISVLGALALGAQRLLPILQLMFSSWSSLRAGKPALDDVLAMLEQPLPAHASSTEPVTPIAFDRDIALEAATFRYNVDSEPVLNAFSLTIKRGEKVGFIGATGSGKSTLLDIVMGLISPDEGRLVVDGIPIDDSNIRGWQVRIAHVPQHIFLTDDTIAENIAFGVPRPEIDMDRVREAAVRAQVANVIEALDEGYDTPVGERGVRLSGGQRQRIGIARALYKKADLLVLDEATSALDTGTEGAVMDSLDSLGQELTVLMVAHRLSTLRNCGRIVELEQGRIRRIGRYDEIIGDGTSTSMPNGAAETT